MSNEPIWISDRPTHVSATAPMTMGRRMLWPILGALMAVALGACGIALRWREEARLADWTQRQAAPSVQLATIKAASGGQALILPGEVKAFNEAQIRARVSGYLKSWNYDIGARVKADAVLATIDAPELDQQYEQAKSELEKTEAQARLAKLTSKRWAALRASAAVSQQSVDEKGGEVDTRLADVASARANMDRLKALKGFTSITAPFSGIVTARKIDVGVLVGPGNPIELFDIADIHQMRVYVRVPQSFANRIKQGMTATLTLSQYPDRKFDASVVATSDAIAGSSRTLLVQLLVDNSNGALLPGSFTEVHFQIPEDPNVIRIPATALLFRRNELRVATIGTGNKVSFKKLFVDRDLGTEVLVTSGVKATDKIIDYPSELLRDGDVVEISQPTVDGQEASSVRGERRK